MAQRSESNSCYTRTSEFEAQLPMASSFICGITGPSGSGKTTLASSVFGSIESVTSVLLHQDSYYKDQGPLPLKIRHTLNYDHPDAFDNELFSHQIRCLCQGSAVEKPIYDFSTHTRAHQTITVRSADVIILEGLLLLHDDDLRDLIDFKIYVDTDREQCLARRIERDVLQRGRTREAVLSQYFKTVKPMHEKFVEPQKEYADLIVSGSGGLDVNVNLILTKIKGHVS